jgi:toxin ParE1/3/4
MARLIVSSPAQADSNAILRYLAFHAGRAVAARYAASFESLFERLTRHPESGAPRPELGAAVRICVVSPYIVIYECEPAASDAVTVLRILHGRRRVTGAMLTPEG